MKTKQLSIPLILIFGFMVILPKAEAVVPPPDGGYPGFTTAEGTNALKNLTTGVANTGTGWYSLFTNTEGSFNTGVGAGTLAVNNGDQNTATGVAALMLNTSGGFNTADGALALQGNSSGNSNTATGNQALLSNTVGNENTAVGLNTLRVNTMGDNNTAVGSYALSGNTTGSFNIAVGRFAGFNVNTANNVICIGLAGADVSDTCFIGNIRSTTTQHNNAIPVVVDTAGQLGTVSSSRRFKKQIKPMDTASEAVLALKPVTFSYKSDSTSRLEFGLIAEDVAQVNPDLVVHDEKGAIYTVRYDAVNAMLLNEFLKEHRRVEELSSTVVTKLATIADLKSTAVQQQKAMNAMAAQIEAQGALIQKVSEQLEASKPAPQVAVNNP